MNKSKKLRYKEKEVNEILAKYNYLVQDSRQCLPISLKSEILDLIEEIKDDLVNNTKALLLFLNARSTKSKSHSDTMRKIR